MFFESKEIHHIGEVKTKAGSAKSFVELDYIKELKDDVIGSAKELIVSCKEYRQRHIEKPYLSWKKPLHFNSEKDRYE